MEDKEMKINNFRYEKIKRKVVEILAQFKISVYPISWEDICKKLNIKVVEYNLLSSVDKEFVMTKTKDGFAHIIKYTNGEILKFICYNSDINWWRIKFTIFHEIGHIVLAHTEHSQLADAEADFFAAYIMVPLPLVDKYNIQDHTEIEDKFAVGSEMAFNSFNRYVSWKKYKSNHNLMDYDKYINENIILK